MNIQEDRYSGHRSDVPLKVTITTLGDEVMISGHIHLQAYHPEGSRMIFYSLLRDGFPLFTRGITVEFSEGRIDETVHLSHIDLPPAGTHQYEAVLSLRASEGEPIYTGRPVIDKRLRAREIPS